MKYCTEEANEQADQPQKSVGILGFPDSSLCTVILLSFSGFCIKICCNFSQPPVFEWIKVWTSWISTSSRLGRSCNKNLFKCFPGNRCAIFPEKWPPPLDRYNICKIRLSNFIASSGISDEKSDLWWRWLTYLTSWLFLNFDCIVMHPFQISGSFMLFRFRKLFR